MRKALDGIAFKTYCRRLGFQKKTDGSRRRRGKLGDRNLGATKLANLCMKETMR
jgi:hypothetical protein